MSYSPRDLVEMMLEASRQLDEAQVELQRCVREESEAEATYRLAKANSYLSTQGTVGEREAQVDKIVAAERKRAYLAEALSKSALEAVRNRRQQLSVLQSVASSLKEEALLARTGPGP